MTQIFKSLFTLLHEFTPSEVRSRDRYKVWMYKTWRLLLGQPIDLKVKLDFWSCRHYHDQDLRNISVFWRDPHSNGLIWDTSAGSLLVSKDINVHIKQEKGKEKEKKNMKAMSLSYNYVTSNLHPNYLIRQIKDKQQISW